MYMTDNLHCELGLHGLATFYPIILHALEMSIHFPNSAISHHYCNLRISHSNTKLLVLALTSSVINHLFNVFCILFPCWDHGSEIQSGKLPGCPPPALLCLQLPCFLLMTVVCCSQKQRTNPTICKLCFLLFTFSDGDYVNFPAQHRHLHYSWKTTRTFLLSCVRA